MSAVDVLDTMFAELAKARAEIRQLRVENDRLRTELSAVRAESDRFGAALERIAKWPLSPGNDLLYIARNALEL